MNIKQKVAVKTIITYNSDHDTLCMKIYVT